MNLPPPPSTLEEFNFHWRNWLGFLYEFLPTPEAAMPPRMTTAKRDALVALNGMWIYNTTTEQFNFFENGAWVTK